MIATLQISAVHSHLTDATRTYVHKKIGSLDKYIPRNARQSVQAEVKLKQIKSKDKQTHECEVIMKLPKSTLTAHNSATTVLAAIDATEDNLKNQLKKYKDMHAGPRAHRRLINSFKRQEV